ncbi:MAG TPA: transcription-repair coupling factor, partial [Actinoplanes sp.]|nr:transcription-repair coupling factor [Actinoplanes sp.]
MQLSGLLPAALRDRALARARDLARAGFVESDALDLTAPASLRPFIVAAVAGAAEIGGAGKPVLAVTATSREADDLAEALGCLINPSRVAVFPSWETLPHERLSPRSDTVGKRLAVLRRLAHPTPGDEIQVVVAPVRSVLQPQLKGLGDLEPVELTTGGGADLDEVAHRL